MRRILLTFILLLVSLISYSQKSEIYNDEWRESIYEKINFITFKNQSETITQFRVYRGDSKVYNTTILNSFGVEVFSASLNKEDQFDISNLYPGIYFIRVIDEDGNYLIKQIFVNK